VTEKALTRLSDGTKMDGGLELSKEMERFDFLEGEWDALCGSKSPDGLWSEGRGTLTATKELDGCVSVERFEGPYCGSLIKGLGLRAFNRQSVQWEHTWTDSLEPGNFVVWRGRFEGDSIHLHADWTDRNGHHVLSRLTWSQITLVSAHWVSHRSIDDGRTWTKHWEIQFKKKSVGGVGTAAARKTWF
jgi:hypothetical protein